MSAATVPVVGREERRDLVEVVEGRDHGVARGAGGDTGRARDREGREPAAGAAREQRVGVTVVATLELDEGVLAGRATGEPDRGHRGLGPGGDEPHLFDRGHHRDDPLRELHLCFGRDAEGGSSPGGLDRGIHDLLPPVSEEQRSPRLAEVDVTSAVGVLEVGALAPDGEPRGAADRTERADRRVHAAGDRSLRSLEEFLGPAHGPSVYERLRSDRL